MRNYKREDKYKGMTSQELTEKIDAADMVLVGIGEAFALPIENDSYAKGAEEERRAAYTALFRALEGKNYFVITLCTDGLIAEAGLDERKLTDPCGSLLRLQCSQKCTEEIMVPDDILREQILSMRRGETSRGETQEKLPICSHCGAPMAWNTIETENYAEEGYLDSWSRYKLWLQGTVNRKVLLLELGAGMKFPTVIRWPFEKIVYFNRKSELIRVNDKLYQTTEEIKDRSIGVNANPISFLKSL